MILCVVLLALAGAVLWMKSATEKVSETTGVSVSTDPPPRSTPPPPLDLSTDQIALAQITNAPAVLLSGEHNLFNPVTWKREPNGRLLKILKSGPDALVVTKIIPLARVINYIRTDEGSIYVMGIQKDVDPNQTNNNSRPKVVYPRMDERSKSFPFIVRGVKGPTNDPTEINLEMTDTGESNLWVSANKPLVQVQSYLADLKYPPESKTMTKEKVKDNITLDGEPYNIVEITNDAIRVKSLRTTHTTEIKWTKSP
ncbi:MAG TPA: hypothetical protein VGO59_17575 [Verrucomicrobiae bacterium]